MIVLPVSRATSRTKDARIRLRMSIPKNSADPIWLRALVARHKRFHCAVFSLPTLDRLPPISLGSFWRVNEHL